MYIANTWFTQDRRHRYTWMKTEDKYNIIIKTLDYTAQLLSTQKVNSPTFKVDVESVLHSHGYTFAVAFPRYWNSVCNAKAYPGADTSSQILIRWETDGRNILRTICTSKRTQKMMSKDLDTFQWILSSTQWVKNAKAEGKNGIPAELLKALGKRELYDICNEIYVTGEWPDDVFGFSDNPNRKKHKSVELKNHLWLSVACVKDSVEDLNPQARICCRVIPWEGSVWF